MKFIIFTLLVSYICYTSAFNDAFSAQSMCDPARCGDGQVSICEDGINNCVMLDKCTDVALIQTIQGIWAEGGRQYTLYTVRVRNYGKRTIKQFSIQTDCTLDVRDKSSLWSIEYNNYFFSIPKYYKDIKPGEDFIFGYVDHGLVAPNLYIRAISY